MTRYISVAPEASIPVPRNGKVYDALLDACQALLPAATQMVMDTLHYRTRVKHSPSDLHQSIQ